MKRIKQVMLFVALLVLLIGAVSANDATEHTTITSEETQTVLHDITQVSQTDTIQENNKYIDEKIETEIKQEPSATKSIQKNINNKASTKTETEVNDWDTLKTRIGELSDATQNTTITLNTGTYNVDGIIKWENKNIELTIDGNGQTIDANQKKVFHFTSETTVILKNITIKNAKTPDGYGAAIDNSGNLTIINTTLQNNNARYGGAINNNGNITIINTTLQNNNAEYYGG